MPTSCLRRSGKTTGSWRKSVGVRSGWLISSVFKALDLSTSPPRTVALKSTGVRRRGAPLPASVVKEIANLRRAAGDQVVPLLGVCFKENENTFEPVLAFEYLPHDLLGLGSTGVRLTPPAAAHVFRQVTSGLARLHAQGISHRDLKSSLTSRQYSC